MITSRKPSPQAIAKFLFDAQHSPFSYDEPGKTRDAKSMDGYLELHHRVQLGKGEAAFNSACEALKTWRMFDLGWVELAGPKPPIERGRVAAVMIRAFGFWWTNATRIVYTLDDNTGKLRRFGFAYGTLHQHAESGEERFLIEWNWSDDTVWYDLYSFSRPNHWLAVLGNSVARFLQRRAARQSLAVMEKAVQEAN